MRTIQKLGVGLKLVKEKQKPPHVEVQLPHMGCQVW